jgi:hypothetical protein
MGSVGEHEKGATPFLDRIREHNQQYDNAISSRSHVGSFQSPSINPTFEFNPALMRAAIAMAVVVRIRAARQMPCQARAACPSQRGLIGRMFRCRGRDSHGPRLSVRLASSLALSRLPAGLLLRPFREELFPGSRGSCARTTITPQPF